MAGVAVALARTHLRFAWQAWQLWHWAGSGGVLGCRWLSLVTRDAVGLCVPGVALGDIHWRFASQAWHFARIHLSFRVAGVALVAPGWVWWRAWSPLVARDAAALCVAGVVLGDIHDAAALYLAGVALGDIHLRFARHWRHPHSICVASVALGDIHLHLRARRGTWGTGLALGWLWWRVWSPLVAKIRQTQDQDKI